MNTEVKKVTKSSSSADIKLALNDTAFDYGQSDQVTIGELASIVHGLSAKIDRALNRLGIK